MNLDPKHLAGARSLVAAALCLAVLGIVGAACSGGHDEAGQAPAAAIGNRAAGGAEEPAPAAPPAPEPAAEPAFSIAVKVAMPEYGFETASQVEQHSTFVVPDESGTFGVGFQPERLSYDGDAVPVVELAVLDIRNLESPDEQRIPWATLSVREGEVSTVRSPDGEGDLQVTVTGIDPDGGTS
jgi:hypothetical protein